ncbi:MAG: FtsX-like permease family protein, partial [Pedobacter sp.]
VLISAVLTTRGQRLKESVLLRTLGASRKQILAITAIEYFFLGALSAGAGIILALTGSWLLAIYSFDSSFNPAFLPVFLLFFTICSLVVITGVLSSRSVLNTPPLAVLNS